MCGRSYRPRPDNGSGDSPRTPFLSQSVNHIGKLALVEVVYHLFGGSLRPRVHSHVERPVRLKTKSARRILQLQTAHSDVGQQAVGKILAEPLSNFGERGLHQRDLRPVSTCRRNTGATVQLQLRELSLGYLERRWIFIEPNQMSRCAEAFWDFVTVFAQAHRGVDIRPATPHV